MSESGKSRRYGNIHGRTSDKTDDKEKDSCVGYNEEEEEEADDNDGSRVTRSKAAEEGAPKRLASALRPSKKKSVTKHSTVDNEDSGEQGLIHIRGGGSDGNLSDEEHDNEWIERDRTKPASQRRSRKAGESRPKERESFNGKKNAGDVIAIVRCQVSS